MTVGHQAFAHVVEDLTMKGNVWVGANSSKKWKTELPRMTT